MDSPEPSLGALMDDGSCPSSSAAMAASAASPHDVFEAELNAQAEAIVEQTMGKANQQWHANNSLLFHWSTLVMWGHVFSCYPAAGIKCDEKAGENHGIKLC